jgi:WD40 repeat protein
MGRHRTDVRSHRSPSRARAGTDYDAFMSYSHALDGQLAPALQAGLQHLARHWYQLRALRIFMDETGLTVDARLWGSIAAAIDGSRFFVLLASKEAAASPWVNREIEHWLTRHPADRILPVLTDGDLVWDGSAGDFDSAASTALPPALRGCFDEEPRHLDLRWAREESQLDLRHIRFRQAVADLAAPLHGLPKEELESEDVRRHRHVRRLARITIASLVLLLLASLVAGGLALSSASRAAREADRATQEATVANARRVAAQAVAGARRSATTSLLLAVEAYRLHDSVETRSGLLTVLQRTAGIDQLVTGFGPGEQVAGLSGDGSTLAVGTDAGEVLLIERRTRSRRVRFATGQRGPVSVVFAADGRRLATLSSDHTVRLWDTETGRAFTPLLRSHNFPVTRGAFSVDNRFLVTEDGAGRGVLWDATVGRPIDSIPQVEGGDDVAFSPTGHLLAVAAEGTLVLDMSTMTEHFRTDSHLLSEDTAVAFSPDGVLLAVPNWPERIVEFWDTRSGRLHHQTVAVESTSYVNRLAFSVDGSQLVAGMGDGTITRWNVASGLVIGSSVAGHSETVAELAFDAERQLVSAAASSVAKWRSDRSDQFGTRVPVSDLLLADIVVSPDDLTLAILDTGGSVTLVDQRTLERLAPLIPAGSYGTGAGDLPRLAFDNAGASLFVADRDGALSIIDVQTRRRSREKLQITNGMGINGVDTTPEEGMIAVGGGDGNVVLVDARRWEVRRKIREHGGLPVLDVDFGPNGSTLASAGIDGRIVIQDLESGRRTAAGKGGSAAGAIEFSTDGRTLAGGFEDGTVAIIDPATGRAVGPALAGHGGGVTDVAFSPDGRMLAVSSNGGGVVLWDLGSRQRLGEAIEGDSRTVNSLAFSRDGQQLFAVGGDGAVVRWHLGPDAWVLRACTLAGRNLTSAEWRRVFGDRPYRQTCEQWQ